MSDFSDPKPRLTIDEIMSEISRLAQDQDAGADRFRALKLLATSQAAAVTLSEPRADGEVVDRLARVMRGAGPALSQAAYQRAFPSARNATFAGKQLVYSDATPEIRQQARRCTSLKLLYKHFPQAKMSGVPKGFPSGRSYAVKAAWCQEQALKMLMEAEMARRKEGHEALKSADDLVRLTEGTNGSQPVPADLRQPGLPAGGQAARNPL